MKDHPLPHSDLNDRISRAKSLRDTKNIPFPIFVDNWTNDFDNLFRAWPDQYYFVDSDGKILAKSMYEYGKAYVLEDCYDLLLKYIR